MFLDFSILIKSHKYSNQNIIQNQINKITQHKVKLSLRKELLIWSCEDSESSGVLALGLGLELPDLGPTGSWAYYSKNPIGIGLVNWAQAIGLGAQNWNNPIFFFALFLLTPKRVISTPKVNCFDIFTPCYFISHWLQPFRFLTALPLLTRVSHLQSFIFRFFLSFLLVQLSFHQARRPF